MGFSEDDRPHDYIIRIISPPHCARGSKGCEKCAEAAEVQIPCLIRVFLDGGMVARPMMEVEVDGALRLLEFDIIKRFTTVDEAKAYAKDNGISNIRI